MESMNKVQLYQFLTYNYSNYKARELIYQKIIDEYHASLKPDTSVMSELDIARGQDLKKSGICKMPVISLSICEYLKKNTFQKYQEAQNLRDLLCRQH